MTPAKSHSTLARLAKLAAGATVAFSILTYFGEMHWLLELFSHFRAQYLGTSLLLAVLLLLLGTRAWAGVMLVTALVNLVPILPWYSAVGIPTAAAGTGIKVLHANVYAHNQDAGRLLAMIAGEEPEIVFLQEINERWLANLDALASAYPFRHALPRPDKFGIALYAREPPLALETIDSVPNGYPTLRARFLIDGEEVTFVSTHPVSPTGTHNIAARNVQLASIAELLAESRNPRVLIGDLNTSLFSHRYAGFVEATGLVDARRGFGLLPTWPAQVPIVMIPIDHCLVSTDVTVLDVKTGPYIGSDHLPLIVTLTMR